MDYIRISSQRSAVSSQGLVAEPVEALTAHSSQLTAKEVKELLKDWIKLYPNSFAPDVEPPWHTSLTFGIICSLATLARSYFGGSAN